MSKKVAEKMFTELTKGQDVQHPTITAEQLTDAMLDSVSGCLLYTSEDGTAGGCGFGAFQDEGSGAALQLVREYLDDAAIVHLV